MLFGSMMENGDLSERMQERIQLGSKMPGWTRTAEFDWYSTLIDPEG